MESKNENDFLSFASQQDILKIIKDEILVLSDKIIKINRYNMSQERNIIITTSAVYNLKKKSLKRRIDIAAIRGITISKITDEFVIHGNDVEYDYEYVSQRRKKIIAAIAIVYERITGEELKFSELNVKSLKNVVTLKKEKKKNANFSRMAVLGLTSVKTFLYGVGGLSTTFIVDCTSIKKRSSRSQTLLAKHKTIQEVSLEDFQVMKVLGRGSFGKVCLVQYKPTQEIYAMKSIKKDILIGQDQIENTLLEKKILESLDHPFLVGLIFCFQTEERIYFIMPYIPGGELFQHLRKFKIFDEEKVKFYASQIALALEHLHNYGIIYRDLKPENILMDEEGYLKLADFGMAKRLKGEEKAKSFCGTPEYLSPEIINGEGYNKAADWWSFGVLIYEMLCGIPPFYNENLERMYELIQVSELKFPKKIQISKDAQNLIAKLLDRNQTTRYGAKGGLNEIKMHPFFASIDFDLIFQRKLTPPFAPTISGKLDVQNFDEVFTNENIDPSILPEKNLDLIKKNQERFKDFSN